MAGATVSGVDSEKLVSYTETDLHSHPHSGFDFAHDGGKMEITKLTIVDGIIT